MSKFISEIVGSILNFIPQCKIENVLISEKFIIPYIQFGNLSKRVLCSLNNQELNDAIKNLNWNRQKTFLYACRKGSKKVVKLLLKDSRVDPTDENNFAIKWASNNGHYEVTELLLN